MPHQLADLGGRHHDGAARAVQPQPLGVRRDHRARHRTARGRGVCHAVARVEAAELAGAGVEPGLQGGVERAGAGRATVARGDHLGLLRRDADRTGHRVGDELHRAVHRLARVPHGHDHDLLTGRLHLVELADPDPRDQLADRARVGGAGDDLRAAAGRHQIREDPAGAGRPQHPGVPAQHETGAVRQRLDEHRGRFHIELWGVQHGEQIERERALLVASGALGVGQQPGDGDGRGSGLRDGARGLAQGGGQPPPAVLAVRRRVGP
ncbi:hypothetical protein SSPO_076910 [Streptomyces antimycoticus]|uniref:Uncharacterized protein n=1 Tax=Streptomyces antimycoticus TaxID=68175 RepID=A0A499USL2_9ACTN|nr:hypothetical protein SSPO_076910 [Streptomyces antimycoticus]